MSRRSSSRQQRFARKPVIIIEQPSHQLSPLTIMKQKRTFQLKINQNVMNVVVASKPQQRQEQLNDLLYTLSKPKQKRSVEFLQDQKSSFSKNVFLDYSPQTINRCALKLDLDESFSLLTCKNLTTDGKQNNSTSTAEEVCIQTQKDIHIISPFELQDSIKYMASGLNIYSLGSSNSIFRVNYSYNSQARLTLSEQKYLFKGPGQRIIIRLSKYFKNNPLSLFTFYSQVVSCYEHIKLRQYLVKNSITFFSAEIECLQRSLDMALDMCKGHQMIEFMLMTQQEDDMLIVNLTSCNLSIPIDLSAEKMNFWKVFSPIFSEKINRKGVLKQQVEKLQNFLSKLI